MTKVLDSFCRTCMIKIVGQTNQIIASFHIFQTEDFAHKFTQCTNLQVHPDDEYPSSVCENCLASVLSLYDFQIMCRDSMDKFSIMLVEPKPEPEISCHLGNNNSAEFLGTMDNQVVMKCEPELAVVVDPVLPSTNSQLAEIELPVQAGITGLQATNENQKTDDRATKKIMVKKTKSHYKSLRDEIHCNEDKLEKSSDEEGKLQIQEPTSSNNRKSKRAKHLNRSSKAGITDLQATYENQHTDDGTTTKLMAKKTKFHDKSSQDEKHCNEDEDKLENSSVEEGFNTDSDCASPDSKAKTSLGLPFQCDTCSKKFRFQHRLEAHKRRHQGQRGYSCTRGNCERTFNHLSYLQQHFNDHDGIPRPIYKCEFENCQQSYTSKTGLRAHKRKKHSGKPIKSEIHMCETCGTVLASSQSLRDHRFIHADKSEWPFVCDVEGCSKRFYIHHQLKIHQKRHAGIKDYACPHCEMRFVSPTELKIHINHHTWEKTWSCDFCPKVCNSPAKMRAHIKNNHGHRADMQTGRFQCSFCDNAFPTVAAKKYHERIHTGEKPHVCDECGKKFRLAVHLRYHMRTHIKDAPRDYVCRICGRAYSTSQTLKHHEMQHTGEKPYKCDECDLTFRWPKSLTGHQRLHGHRVGEHPYKEIKKNIKQPLRFQCSFCDNDFMTVNGRKSHEMIHTGEKPYVCDECGQKFRHPATLKTHMRTHIKDAPRGYVCRKCGRAFLTPQDLKRHEMKHVCRICGRAYSTSQSLKHHEMQHTGEKPYKCEECGLTFRWPKSLTRHQRLHGHMVHQHPDKEIKKNIKRPRRFQCSFCDKAFEGFTAKKHHEMIHTGEKPHVCDECGKKFRQKNNLTRHQRLHQRDKQVKETTESDKQANSKDISKDE